jgi:hypothetical protein
LWGLEPLPANSPNGLLTPLHPLNPTRWAFLRHFRHLSKSLSTRFGTRGPNRCVVGSSRNSSSRTVAGSVNDVNGLVCYLMPGRP